MAVRVRHLKLSAETAGANTQSFTFTNNGGQTPVAALLFMNPPTGGLETAPSMLSIGATDGTNSRCVCVSSEDNVAVTNTWSKGLNDSVIMSIDPNTGTLTGRATFDSFSSGTVVINWNDNPPTAMAVVVIAFFGSIDVAVGDFDSLTDTSKNVGFAPSQVWLFGINNTDASGSFTTSATTSSTAHATISFGCTIKEGTDVTRTAIGYHNRDNVTLNLSLTTFYDEIGAASCADGVAEVVITPTSTGFDITDNSSSMVCGYLAINYKEEVVCKILEIGTPTATGSNPITGVGFKTQAVIEFQSPLTTYGHIGDGGSIGIGIMTNSTSASSCIAQRIDDANLLTVTRSKYIANAQNLRNQNAGEDWIATFTSFDINGYTKNYSATETTSRKTFYIAISEISPLGWLADAEKLPPESDEVVNYG